MRLKKLDQYYDQGRKLDVKKQDLLRARMFWMQTIPTRNKEYHTMTKTVHQKAVPVVGDNTATQSENSKIGEITGAIKAGVTNVTDLLHVSWKSDCQRSSTNSSCSDCRPIPVSN